VPILLPAPLQFESGSGYHPTMAQPWSPRPVITFLTDFGPDAAAAICRGVMLDVARDAQIIDISHSVRKFAVREAAVLLRWALPWMPVGIHLAIVDPGVGTERKPLALRVGRGDILLGPDNGILMPAADRLGGVAEARLLANRELMLPAMSHTFHGRDVFAPMAGHLAAGLPLSSVGPEQNPLSIVQLRLPEPTIEPGALETSVTYVDSFGNLRLAGSRADLVRAIGTVETGRPLTISFLPADGRADINERTVWASTFAEVTPGGVLLYEDSFGGLACAVNQGDMAARLGLASEDRVRIVAAS